MRTEQQTLQAFTHHIHLRVYLCAYVVRYHVQCECNMYSYNCVARLLCIVQLWKLHASVCTPMACSVYSSLV